MTAKLVNKEFTPVAELPLTALDRCDRCGAQAYVRVMTEKGGILLFCGHHANAVARTLKPSALHWHDETSRIRDILPQPEA